MPRALWLLAAALLAGGCSMFQDRKAEFQPVSDADYGRLAPDQLGPVNAARDQLFAARDEVARAKLRLQQAENEAELARADQSMVKAAMQRAKAEGNVARKSNAPEAKAKAQEAAAQAELQARSARAHLAYANQLGRARQAELEAAEALVRVREAEHEQAKLQALSQAGIPAATKYDASLFAARVAEARREHLEAQSEARVRLAEAQKGENTWRTLHAQYEERVQGQTPATATGAGAPGPQAPPAEGGEKAEGVGSAEDAKAP
ncbi:MAG TPA: hypothetical protein VEB43_14365 [Anaeromyxobacter sp.]|nr:hypothetical protein [Anaeromyxobacter sp.]